MKKYKIYAIIFAILLTCLAGCGQSKAPIPGTNGQMVTAPTVSEAPTMTDSTEAVLPTEKESSEAPTADTVVTEPSESVTDATESKEPDRQPEVTEPVPTAPVQTEPPVTAPPKEDAQPEPTVPTAKPEPAPDPTKPTQPTQPSATAEPPKETEPTEPVPTQPAPTEPKPTEPQPTEPMPTEPAPTEPVPTEPKPTEPEPTEPAPTEPTPTEPEPDTFTEADHKRIISEVTTYAESYTAKGFTFQWKESMTFGWDVGYMGTPRVEYEGVDGVIEMLKYHIDLIYKTSTDPAYGLTTTVMTYKVEQITVDGDLAYVVIYGG